MNVQLIHTIVFDFDGVFTDNKVYLTESGIEMVRCDRSDGLGVAMLKKMLHGHDVDIFILSTEKNAVVMHRAKKLGLDCIHGSQDKLNTLTHRLMQRFGSVSDRFDGVVFLGNDLNDVEVMRRVGYSYAPSDAHFAVKAIATEILEKKGGDGFVREFVEKFFCYRDEARKKVFL